MPLEDPIIEVHKPAKLGQRLLDMKPPENILPLLELLRVTSVAYEDADQVAYWEITTLDGLHYVRVQTLFLGDSEEEWRKMIGMLLDYAKSQEKR